MTPYVKASKISGLRTLRIGLVLLDLTYASQPYVNRLFSTYHALFTNRHTLRLTCVWR